jgi:hypothetical protein
MVKYFRISLPLIVVFMIGGCLPANHKETSMTATPSLIAGGTIPLEYLIESISLKYTSNVIEMCIIINQKPLWNSDLNDPKILTDHLVDTFSLEIDSDPLPKSTINTTQALMIEPIFGKDKDPIGYVESSIEACSDISLLNVGNHRAAIEIMSLSEEKIRYDWEFVIHEDRKNIDSFLEVIATPSILTLTANDK